VSERKSEMGSCDHARLASAVRWRESKGESARERERERERVRENVKTRERERAKREKRERRERRESEERGKSSCGHVIYQFVMSIYMCDISLCNVEYSHIASWVIS